ncbi:MAG TPA: dolichyl-phosphate beta-glucosyltransferase [Candidatus Dormibacteraeota bacterium]|nr:dolichyl-phosphate beta-glucosyltransferase [Candidatus Dormibacteraeota bacterium]
MDLSVVVPCYNEEDRLPASLARVASFLEGHGGSFELILVDDGSDDRTLEIIREAGRRFPYVQALSLPHRGKGAALAEGVRRSRGRLVLLSDADFSTPIEELGRLEAAIAEGADVAIGSRAAPGAREVDQPLYRRLMGKAFNLLVQALLLPGVWDTQCGFKLFRGPVARQLFAQLHTTGFAFDVEVLYLARRSGHRVREVPVRWINSPSSRVSPLRDARAMALDLLRIRFTR